MHYVQFVLAWLPRISRNSNETYRHYNFQALANISGKFRKNSGNIKFPEISQPSLNVCFICWFMYFCYCWCSLVFI